MPANHQVIMDNKEIAEIFREMAVLLELKGDNPFRIRAYERAAQNIESLTKNLQELIASDSLENIPGIGKDLSKKIKELSETGGLKYHQQLKKTLPRGLLDMLEIPGLGPKTVKLIYDNLKISNIKSLGKAARTGKLDGLPGVKHKTEENILKGIDILKAGRQRTLLPLAQDTAKSFIEPLGKLKEVKIIEEAGSLRRKKETVKDIDILVVSSKASGVMNKFVKLPNVKQVNAKGTTKSSVVSKQNIQVDLRVVDKDSFGAASLYFTGSKDFNISLRHYAITKGYKINEYGAFKINKKKERKVAGKTEKEIFDLFNMQYISPVLREDRGEIKAALSGSLPKIVELSDIKGDLHVHSRYSDGSGTIEELAKIAQDKGYEYLGITDHSQGLRIAGGLNKGTLFRKIKEIEKLNKKFKKIRLLAGTEVDILSDGSLDYPDDTLKELDLSIAAIHSGFKQNRKQLTHRIISAIKNKYIRIIAHPTGRLSGIREACDIDLDQILSACLDYNVALEINAYPQRLDLNDINCKRAKEKGVKLVLGTDSHRFEHFNSMELGLWVAQRGWLEKGDVINTLDLPQLMRWLG